MALPLNAQEFSPIACLLNLPVPRLTLRLQIPVPQVACLPSQPRDLGQRRRHLLLRDMAL